MRHGTIDYTPLLGGFLAYIVVMAAVCAGVIIGVRIVQTRKRAEAEIANAITSLEPLMREVYSRENEHTHADHYMTWRLEFIQAVNKVFGRGVWRTCAKKKVLPPVNHKTGKLLVDKT